MSRALSMVAAAYRKARVWANDYEPARARAILAAVVQVAAVAGVSLGDFPAQADKALVVIGVLATLIAGQSIRGKVTKPATTRWLHTYSTALEGAATADERDQAVQVANGEAG